MFVKVCAGIVSYNPDIERLAAVLNAVRMQVDTVSLVDNGSVNLSEIVNLTCCYENLRFKSLGDNLGIAAALNDLCASARNDGYTHILTLDQDTIVDSDMVEHLLEHVDDGVGIVCPRVLYDGNEKYQPIPAQSIETVSWAITSGSLTSLKAWHDVGGFDEQMFIDGVDKDFCLRLRQKDWSLVRINGVVIHHRLGELKCRRVLGRTIYVTHHPAWRRYYMARNRVYLYRKGLVPLVETASSLAKDIAKATILEGGGKSKAASILRGIRDGYRMRVSKSCEDQV